MRPSRQPNHPLARLGIIIGSGLIVIGAVSSLPVPAAPAALGPIPVPDRAVGSRPIEAQSAATTGDPAKTSGARTGGWSDPEGERAS